MVQLVRGRGKAAGLQIEPAPVHMPPPDMQPGSPSQGRLTGEGSRSSALLRLKRQVARPFRPLSSPPPYPAVVERDGAAADARKVVAPEPHVVQPVPAPPRLPAVPPALPQFQALGGAAAQLQQQGGAIILHEPLLAARVVLGEPGAAPTGLVGRSGRQQAAASREGAGGEGEVLSSREMLRRAHELQRDLDAARSGPQEEGGNSRGMPDDVMGMLHGASPALLLDLLQPGAAGHDSAPSSPGGEHLSLSATPVSTFSSPGHTLQSSMYNRGRYTRAHARGAGGGRAEEQGYEAEGEEQSEGGEDADEWWEADAPRFAEQQLLDHLFYASDYSPTAQGGQAGGPGPREARHALAAFAGKGLGRTAHDQQPHPAASDSGRSPGRDSAAGWVDVGEGGEGEGGHDYAGSQGASGCQSPMHDTPQGWAGSRVGSPGEFTAELGSLQVTLHDIQLLPGSGGGSPSGAASQGQDAPPLLLRTRVSCTTQQYTALLAWPQPAHPAELTWQPEMALLPALAQFTLPVGACIAPLTAGPATAILEVWGGWGLR